jgi:hypothetical protein
MLRIMLLLVLPLAAVYLALRARRRRIIRRAATNILNNARVLYSGAHEYREVPLAAFPHLDAGYYDTGRQVLEADGFSWLADIENATISAAGGVMMPTAMRMLVGEEGAVIAAIYHARTRGPGASYRITDLETPLDDGTFLITSNAELAGSFASPPEVHAEFLAADTSVATVLARHRARLAEYVRAHEGVAALPTATIADALQHQERLDAIKARFRASRAGVFSAEELQRLAPAGSGSLASDVAAEMVALDTRDAA